MAVIITYDIQEQDPDKHEEVKNAMKANHFRDDYFVRGFRYPVKLPNTTLWIENGNAQSSIQILEKICRDNDAKLEKVFAAQFDPNYSDAKNY